MKALHQFTNVDKGFLLHQLFPQEIPELLEYMAEHALAIKEDEARNRAAWDNGMISFDYWIYLINDASEDQEIEIQNG